MDPSRATHGLSSTEAALRLARDGPNVLPAPRPPSPLRLLLGQLTHFFALMLWGAVALALFAGLPQLAVAIAVIVVLNGTFAFVQEFRASQTAERLSELLPVKATVVRDGFPCVVQAEDLVVDDVLLLESGDRVCADAVIAACADLAVNESTLTGESVPARPDVGGLVFAGTFVTEGEGTVLVVATAGNTRLAAIAALSRQGHRPKSPLAKRLDRVVRVVAVVALAVGFGFFGIALALGTPARDGFVFAIGVTVALVPEGLLPTVTLSLAAGARRMAERNALVRSLESVETLGSTTYLCTDKTGTLTTNAMSVVRVWTPESELTIDPVGYDAAQPLTTALTAPMAELAKAAALASTGRVVPRDGSWTPHGDPMEAALYVLALRSGASMEALDAPPDRRLPFDPRRRRMSAVVDGRLLVKGAVDTVLPRCSPPPVGAEEIASTYATRGLRVLAVAVRAARPLDLTGEPDLVEADLELLGLVGLEDPPRAGATEAVAALRRAGIKIAMVTGDHPATARAIADEVSLLTDDSIVIEAKDLPRDQESSASFWTATPS